MNLLVLVTGKCRDQSMLALEKEYYKRLPAGWKVEVRELAEGTPVQEAKTQMEALARVAKPVMKVVLDEKGQQVGSVELAAKVEEWQGKGIKTLVVMVGGADGFSQEVKAAADWVWSFSKLTFPHQMMRVLLAEQIYRADAIVRGHPYHRA